MAAAEVPNGFIPATSGGGAAFAGRVERLLAGRAGRVRAHAGNGRQLALDENGVEAAAYTAIGIEKMSLMPDAEPVEFKLDRPFFYYVTSPDGAVLFVGVLYNPNL